MHKLYLSMHPQRWWVVALLQVFLPSAPCDMHCICSPDPFSWDATKTVLHKLIPMCQTNQFYDTKECNHCNHTFAYHFSGVPAQSHDTQRFSSMLEIRVHALIIPRQHHQSRVACLSFRGNMPK